MLKPRIIFTTEPELHGIIPEPLQARKVLPDWYKKLPMFSRDDQHRETHWPSRTVKRCPPVLDAMASGWILRTPAEIEIKITKDGTGVEWKTDFNRDVLQPHATEQIAGHPKDALPPLKFLNYWHMKTPPGWSTLFVNPINRENPIIDAIAGVVETDKYFEYINFPSFLKPQGTTFVIPRGYPIVQAIPFKRGINPKATIRPMSKKELAQLDSTRTLRTSHPSLYRDTMWEPK